MVSVLNSWPYSTAIQSRRLLLCLLLLALFWYAQPCWAGKYAYGENIVRVGQSWTDAGPVLSPSRDKAAASPQDDTDYQRQLATLEDQGGPYSEGLAEPLASLGRHHRENGDLEQAMHLYRRALHVVRINDGLYSERQIPILRELLEGYRVSGDLETLDNRYDYYFRLYGNGQPPYTELRLRAALGYLRWQREAVRLGIDEDESRRLLALYQLNEELLAAVGADDSVALPWYRDLVLSQIRNLHLLEDRFAPTVENMGVAPALPMVGSEWQQEDFNKRRLETLQRGSLSHGSGLLQGLIARTAGSGEGAELARTHLELGDWYQWHGSDRRAGEQYQQVVQLLTQEQQPDLLQQWLGQPVELPDNGAFWQPRPTAEPERPVVISVRYDVSARGKVSNMHTTVADPGDEGMASRLKRKLGRIRFRPRWVSGVAEPVTQVQRDYQLIK